MRKLKLIPNSVINLLGISCCSWMAWAPINAYSEQIAIEANILETFESINSRPIRRPPLKVVFADSQENTATANSTIVIQKPLTFDGNNKTIRLATDSHQELLKIEMLERTDACIFENIGSIEGDVHLVKGIFSVPAGVVKGVIKNHAQLVLVANNGQIIDQKIEGSGVLKIQGTGVIKLQTPYPIEEGIIFSRQGNTISSLIIDTRVAPKGYLAAPKEGDWIVFDQDFNGAYAGMISGAGGLAKTGKGVLSLTGNNKNRNSITRIFSGELSIGSPENLGEHGFVSFKGGALHITDSLEIKNSLIGDVDLIIDEGKTAEVSGLVGNEQIMSSSLSIRGGGTICLIGPNPYQGNTNVLGATLQLESEANLGEKGTLILKQATLKAAPNIEHLDLKRDLVLDQMGIIHTSNSTINILGNITSQSEQARLIKEGLGKLAIHGNLHNSNLSIKEGVVHVSPPFGVDQELVFHRIENIQEIFSKIDELKANALSLQESPMKILNNVCVHANADLTIDRNLVYINDLSGDGRIGLRANSGYLVVESGDFAGSLSSFRKHNLTIVKTGKGELKLKGDNSNLLASLVIREGKVQVNGSMGADIIVTKRGVFGGNGSVASLLNEGRVAPGNSIGELHIEKHFRQNQFGCLDIEVNAKGESDVVKVGGLASLAGSLRILPEPGIYLAGTEYTILEAKTVEGTFNNVENTGLDLAVFDVGYKPDEVVLSVTKTMYQLPSASNMSDVSRGLTHLIQNVQFEEGTDAFKVIENIFSVDNKDLEKVYSQMTPVQLGGMTYESYLNASSVINRFTNALRRKDRCVDSISTIWIEPVGHYAHQKHGCGLENYKSCMGGVVIGGHRFANENVVVGAGMGYTHSRLKWVKKRALSHISSFYAGLNGGWVGGDGFYANASLIASTNIFENKRHLKFAKVDHVIKSKHHGIGLTSHLEAGYHFAVTQNIYLRPFMDLDSYHTFERPVHEKESAPLHFHRAALASHEIQGKIAVEATGNFTCNSLCFSPGILLGWIAQTPIGKAGYKVSLNDTGKHLDIKGFQKHKINQQIAIGANVIASYKTTAISLYYELDFGKNRSLIHQAAVSIDLKF